MRFFKRGVRHNFFYLGCTEFFGELRFYYPIAVLIFEAVTGSYALAMAVFSLMYVVQAVAEVPTGILSDKLGRRKTLIVGSGLELLGVVAYICAFVPSVGAVGLFVGTSLIGIACAFYSGNNTAMLYESLAHYRKQGEISKLYGRMRSMSQAGLACSGLAALGLLWLGASFQLLMALTLVPFLFGFVAAVLTVEPPRAHSRKDEEELPSLQHLFEAARLIWRNKRLRSLTLAKSWMFGIGQMGHNFMPGFVDLVWPTWLTPLYRMVQNFVGMVSFWFAGPVIARVGALMALVSAKGLSVVVSLIAFALAMPVSPVLLWVTQVTYAVNDTAVGTLEQENFSDAQRSMMGSIVSVLGSIFAAVVGVALGGLADAFGAVQALIILTLAGLPALVIYAMLFWGERRQVRA